MIIPLEPRRAREVIFLVEEAPAGGLVARAVDNPIAVTGDTWEALEASAREAVTRHFGESQPAAVRLMRLF